MIGHAEALALSSPLAPSANVKQPPCHALPLSETQLSQMAAKADAEGKLLFGAGNICNHYFTVAFLRQVATAYQESPKVLPYHLAKKKVPYAGEDGATVTPDTSNAVKLEAFIFDSFPLAATSAILEVGSSPAHPSPAHPSPVHPSPAPTPTTTLLQNSSKTVPPPPPRARSTARRSSAR